jgi:hypothetical protein
VQSLPNRIAQIRSVRGAAWDVAYFQATARAGLQPAEVRGSQPGDRVLRQRYLGRQPQPSGFEALTYAVDAKRISAIFTEDISRISRDFAAWPPCSSG